MQKTLLLRAVAVCCCAAHTLLPAGAVKAAACEHRRSERLAKNAEERAVRLEARAEKRLLLESAAPEGVLQGV